MNIALITVHKATNYGAILQAYATVIALSKYGEVHTIDYKNPYLKSHLDLIRFKPSFRGIKMLMHDLLNIRNRSVLIKKFRDFIKLNFNLSQELTANQLEQYVKGQYDVYVCGSDQIWNPNIISPTNSIDPIYFLSFGEADAKKISYASSMGNYEFSDQQTSYLRLLLKDFHRISVREIEGKNYLQSLFPDRTITQVVDPTLLLSGSDWLTQLSPYKEQKRNDYILVYSVPRTQLLRKAIKFYSEKFDMPVIAIDKMLVPMDYVDKHIRTAGPGEFIELYANAGFVITDSFHGTCFSVIFEKPFVCIPATHKANRQEGLLSSLGLLDRIIYKESDFSSISQSLDYSETREKLREVRENALAFIDEAFSD
ncbi:MAG: polysaccharide pyruvyl transferase family protein [Chitinophagaceae bacterium]